MLRAVLAWLSGYAAVILFLATLINWATFLVHNGFGLILPPMRDSLGLSHFQEGSLISALSLCSIPSQVGGGVLASRYGARFVVGIACMGSGVFMVLVGVSPGYLFALVMSALVGFTIGGCLVPAMGLLSVWFDFRHRGTVAGVAAAGGGLSPNPPSCPGWTGLDADKGWRVTPGILLEWDTRGRRCWRSSLRFGTARTGLGRCGEPDGDTCLARSPLSRTAWSGSWRWWPSALARALACTPHSSESTLKAGHLPGSQWTALGDDGNPQYRHLGVLGQSVGPLRAKHGIPDLLSGLRHRAGPILGSAGAGRVHSVGRNRRANFPRKLHLVRCGSGGLRCTPSLQRRLLAHGAWGRVGDSYSTVPRRQHRGCDGELELGFRHCHRHRYVRSGCGDCRVPAPALRR